MSTYIQDRLNKVPGTPSGASASNSNKFQELKTLLHRTRSRVGRQIDNPAPMVEARVPAGSRITPIFPPRARDGRTLSIRRFGADPLTVEKLIDLNAITPPLVQMLEACVKSKLNI